MEKRNVVVIGAGIAGIAAVRRIHEDGRFNVTILEASNRIGGRIFSSVIDRTPVEFGATYIHGTVDNVIYELCKQYGLVAGNSDLGCDDDDDDDDNDDDDDDDDDDDTIDVMTTSALLSNGESVPNEILIKCLGKFSELVDNMSSVNAATWAGMYEDTYACLVSEYPKCLENDPATRDVLKAPYSNSLFEFFLNSQSVYEGKEYCKGISFQNPYVELAGDPFARLSNGHTFGSLVDKLVEYLPKDTILYGREVININTENDPILIKCRNGDQFETDHVIITVSLGVLKRRCLDENLLPNECSLFTPALPIEKEEAIRKLGFGKIGKVLLQFDQEVSSKYKFEPLMMLWLSEDKNDPMIQERFPWTTSLYILERVTNTNLYTTWVHGSAVAQIENASKEDIKKGMSYVLEKFLKHPVPKPVDVQMHKWLSDPLFGGCYTIDLTDTPVNIATLMEPVDKNKVMFAGEATHPDQYATVHGAYLTGMREAEKLLKTI